MACVRFGLITEETELEELIGLVYASGKEVEESSKFIETMADVVKKGIEKANEDLMKENQEKLLQEVNCSCFGSPIVYKAGKRAMMKILTKGQCLFFYVTLTSGCVATSSFSRLFYELAVTSSE